MHSDLDDARYAVYLIPPYHVARAVSEIHQMLRKQFGYEAAARFQVHTTVKGFFEKREGPLAPLIEGLDAVMINIQRCNRPANEKTGLQINGKPVPLVQNLAPIALSLDAVQVGHVT